MKEAFNYPDITGGTDGTGAILPEPFNREKRIEEYDFEAFAVDLEDTALFVNGLEGSNGEELTVFIEDLDVKMTKLQAGLAVDSEDSRVVEHAERIAFYGDAFIVDADTVDAKMELLWAMPGQFYDALKAGGLVRPEATEELDVLFYPPAEDAAQE